MQKIENGPKNCQSSDCLNGLNKDNKIKEP